MDELIGMAPAQLTVLTLDPAEFQFAIRLQSRDTADQQWRREDALVLWNALTSSLGLRTRDLPRKAVEDSVCVEGGRARHSGQARPPGC
jgi:hypothetical protein